MTVSILIKVPLTFMVICYRLCPGEGAAVPGGAPRGGRPPGQRGQVPGGGGRGRVQRGHPAAAQAEVPRQGGDPVLGRCQCADYETVEEHNE